MSEEHLRTSPPWGSTTKLVVALTVVAILAGIFIQFHGIIGPLLMAFVLAYLLSPLAGLVRRGLHLSWGLSVSLIYLLFFVVLSGLLTLGGIGLVQQISNLVTGVQASLTSLPSVLQDLSGRVYAIGPFQFDLRNVDLTPISSQLLGIAQSLVGQTGTLLSTIAGGAAQFAGWGSFVIIVSYFVLTDSGGLRSRMFPVDVPGYSEDVSRLTTELGRIWNAFLRGQIIIFILTSLTYLVVLEVLGIRYAIGIAFLGGLAKFLPYIGPFITWTTLALVAYFQSDTIFGLSPLAYAILAVGLGIVIDQTFDNLVTPRIIAQALRVHPAAVLVTAIIGATWLGLLGVILAAPMLATVLLVWRYTVRKMLDLEPWPAGEAAAPPPPGLPTLARIRRFVQDQVRRLKRAP